jgi:RND family efflux transporter MFP subunit
VNSFPVLAATVASLVSALAVGLSGCGPREAQAQGAPQGPPPVTVARPLVRQIVDWDDYVGRFEASQRVEVRPRVSGYLQSVNFTDGQFVGRGQTLFTIDPRPFEAALAQARAEEARARATLANASTELARSIRLVEAQAASREEQEARQAALRQAEAGLAAAQAAVRARALDVEFTRVTAPIGGRVSDARLDRGNFVAAGESLLTTVVQLNPIHFEFEGSEAVYLKYQRQNRAGTRPSSRVAPNPVEIRLQDEPEYRWRGRMDFVDNALDRGSGTIRGRAVVANGDGFLTPGMFGHMRLLGSGAYDALLVPDSAVTTDQSRKLAFVVAQDGTVQPRVVQLGPIVDGLRIVRGGLTAQDRIIINGLQRARPGVKVQAVDGRITPPAPGASPRPAEVLTPPAASATAADAVR